MKISKIQIPIYLCYLRIVVCEEFNKTAKKIDLDDEGEDLDSFGAFTTESGDGEDFTITVFFRPDVDHDLIAHEVVHIVNKIYIERRILHDVNNDENQALFTAWITGQIYKAIKK